MAPRDPFRYKEVIGRDPREDCKGSDQEKRAVRGALTA
jgi:hypothetical protein